LAPPQYLLNQQSVFTDNNSNLNLKPSLALLDNIICAANSNQSASLETFGIGDVSSVEQSAVVASPNNGPVQGNATYGLHNSSVTFFFFRLPWKIKSE
jgi:hypothetical protein